MAGGQRMRARLALGACALLAAFPVGANAAGVSSFQDRFLGKQIAYAGAPGETNEVTVTPTPVGDEALVAFVDDGPGVLVSALRDCAPLGLSGALCASPLYSDEQPDAPRLPDGQGMPAVNPGLWSFGTIWLRDGNDRVVLAPGRFAADQSVVAGDGDDFVDSTNGVEDFINCGSGDDIVVADPADTFSADCEQVSR